MTSPLAISVTASTDAATSALKSLRSELESLNQAAAGGTTIKANASGKEVVEELKRQQAEIKANAAVTVAAEKTKQSQIAATATAMRDAAKVQRGELKAAAVEKQNQIVLDQRLKQSESNLFRARAASVRADIANGKVLSQDAQAKIALLDKEIERQIQVVNVLREKERVAAEAAAAGQAQFAETASVADQKNLVSLNNLHARAINDVASESNKLAQNQRELASIHGAVAREQARATKEAERQAAAQQRVAQADAEVISNMQGSRYALYQVAAAYGVASAAALGFFKASVSSMADYEAAFKQVERTTEGTELQLRPLYNTLKDLGTEIPETFEELAKITQLGGQMGFAISELGQFTETVARFAASTGMAAEASATAFGKMSNLLHVGVEEFENLGSAVAYLGVTTVATDPQITKTATELSGVGYAAGLSTEAVLGMAASFASLDIQPERARSSVLRLFRTLDMALAEGGEKAETWSRQLGMSIEELQRLRDTDPDAFFTDFIASLERVKTSGGDLTTTFNDLGLGSVRDVDAFQRLAGSVDLLTGSIDNARISYANADFLKEASGKVFDSLTSKLQMMRTAWTNLTASIGETPIISGTLKTIVDWITRLLKGLESLPGPVKAFAGSFALIVGLLTAYKAGIALLQAATLAWAYLARNSNNELRISFGGLMEMVGRTSAMIRNMGNETVTAAQRGTQAINAETAALERQNIARGQGAGAAGAGTTLSNVASVGKGLLRATAWTAAIAGAIALAEAGWDYYKSATDSRTEIEKLGQELESATGASTRIAQALKIDTSAGDSAIGSVSTQLKAAREDLEGFNEEMAQYQRTAVTVYTDSAGVAHELSTRIVQLASDGDIANLSQGQLAKKIDETTAAYERQKMSIGESTTQELQDIAVEALQAGGVSGTDLLALRDSGINIGEMIKDGINAGLTTGKMDTSAIQAEIDALAVKQAKAAEDLDKAKGVFLDTARDMSVTREAVDKAEEAFDDAQRRIDDLRVNLGLLNQVLPIVGGEAGVLGEALAMMGVFAGDAGDDLEGFGDDADDAADTTKDLADALKEASEEFNNFIDSIGEQERLTGNLASAFENMGKSIAENGGSFDAMTEAGRNNLGAFEGVMNAYREIVDAEVLAGRLSVEEGATLMAAYMGDLLLQLGNMGIPDEQIQSLVDMLNRVTGFDWKVGVGADITAAMNGINAVRTAMRDTANAMAASGIGSHYSAGAAMNQWALQNLGGVVGTIYTAPVANTMDFGDLMARGFERAKNAAAGAGGAGKKAGDTIRDAMREAEKATKAVEDAFKAAAEAYSSIGKTAFAHIMGEGKVFEALKNMGVALAENGAHLNTFTEDGRKNFAELEKAISSYGDLLRYQIESGDKTFAQANRDMTSFLQQLYQDLVKAGVPAKEINGFFKAMGVSTEEIKRASNNVKPFVGVLGAANEAAKATTESVKALKEEIADYVRRLQDGFDEITTNLFGQQNAADATAKAFNSMANAIKAVNDEIQKLRDESQDYASIIAGQEAIAQGAGVAYAQALANNDPELADLYAYQRDTATSQANAARAEQQKRAQQIAALEASKNVTDGNTDAALDNRAALESLLKTYQDQILALAETGATQEEVERITRDSQKAFMEQGRELGFTDDQLAIYNESFEHFLKLVRDTPNKVTVAVGLSGTEAAEQAIKDLIAGRDTMITPAMGDTTPFRNSMKELTKTRDALIVARAEKKKADKDLNAIAKKNRAADIKANPTGVAAATTALDNIANKERRAKIKIDAMTVADSVTGTARTAILKWLKENGFNAGGLIPGMAAGGLVPGTPPINPYEDNMLARGPGGLLALRSGEFVQSQPAVDYYGVPLMNAINELRIPREFFTSSGGGGTASTTQAAGAGMNINVVANYPQAEPTSKTINKALAMASGLGGL